MILHGDDMWKDNIWQIFSKKCNFDRHQRSKEVKCFLRFCSSCSSFWTTGELLEIYDILGKFDLFWPLVPIGNAIFRENFVIFCIFTCQRHIISWAPFDLREKPLWRYTLVPSLLLCSCSGTRRCSVSALMFRGSCCSSLWVTLLLGFGRRCWVESGR